jgi:hypothetical protein
MKPEPFQFWEDAAGSHFLLLKETRVSGFWLAFKLQGCVLEFLSPLRFANLRCIGKASFA